MQPFHCVLQHDVANPHASTHMATPDDNNHAAIPMRSATTDSRNGIELRTQEQPLVAEHRGGTDWTRNDPNRNRRTDEVPFIAGWSHFTQKKIHGFVLRLPPRNIACNIHAAMTLRFAASRSKPAPIYARGNIKGRQWSSHSNAICNHRFKKRHRTTHTGTTTRCRTQRRNRLNSKRSKTATAAQTRYLSSLYTEKYKVSCSGFLPNSPLAFVTASLPHHFPSSPPHFVTTSLPHHFPSSPHPIVHFPSSPLPFLTTSHRPHLPSSPLAFIITSLRHHFPSSPLPIVTTSLPQHFPSSPLPFLTTSHRHHFPSLPLPFVTSSHRHHFPSSPLPIVTTSLRHHFPSSPLPFVTTSLRHHPVIVSTLHQGQFHRFFFFCYVLLCYVLLYDLPPFVISSLRILFVRNTEVLLPNFLWSCMG